jgi:ubiquinone biosynthesis protein COQ4
MATAEPASISASSSAPASTRHAAPRPAGRLQPLRALRLLIEILRDPDDTDRVFAFFSAVGGDDGPRHFVQFLAEPGARRLLDARSDLAAALADDAALARLPADSLGGAYLRAMRTRGFAPRSLLEIRDRVQADVPKSDAEHEWFYARINVLHDLWHVLTGYGTDPLGEAALLAFSQAQIPNRSFPLLLLGAVLKGPRGSRFAWPRYLWRAFRRGRATRLLTAVPFEELLALPLAEIRARLGSGGPQEWHRDGVWIGELKAGRA